MSRKLISKLSSTTSKSLEERISAPFYSDKKFVTVENRSGNYQDIPVNILQLFQTWVKTWLLDSIKIQMWPF